MIRRACYALLLTCCTTAIAEPLYKWTEADGSITFSPNKPPAGIDFHLVEPSAGISSASSEGANEPVLAAGVGASNTKDKAQKRFPATSSIATLSPEISASESGSVSWSSDVEQPATPVIPTQTIMAPTASATTKGRCEDLRKRVVSLERRLKADLTPEDMDNTVVHMSRYQRSYDKFCVQ